MSPEAFLDSKINLMYAEHWQISVYIYEIIYDTYPFEFILIQTDVINEPDNRKRQKLFSKVKHIMSIYRKTGRFGIDFSLSLELEKHHEELLHDVIILLAEAPYARYKKQFLFVVINE
jgi:hypothetical protein